MSWEEAEVERMFLVDLDALEPPEEEEDDEDSS